MSIVVGLIQGCILAGIYVVAIVIAGFLIAVLGKIKNKVLGNHYYNVWKKTGFLGTPIHELGHAVFCVIFGHKINEIKLYDPKCPDGCAGYVNHSYNPKNPYMRLGCFFIGVGPIIFGSLIILGLEFLLARGAFNTTMDLVEYIRFNVPETIAGYPAYLWNGIALYFTGFFSLANLQSPLWWVNLVLCLLISTHLTLSKPDIDNAKLPFVFVLLFAIAVPTIVSIFGYQAIVSYVNFFLPAGLFMLAIYFLAIFMSAITIVTAIPLRIILDLFSRKK